MNSTSNDVTEECMVIQDEVYDIIKTIKDPEKPNTLEELDVVYENGVSVTQETPEYFSICVEFQPTVPHCSLATLIGLCLKIKIQNLLPHPHKLLIQIKEGTHSTQESVTKQINDKERIAAAMENPNLREIVEKCIAEYDY